MIAGIPKIEIRKAFFGKKLNALLDKIKAEKDLTEQEVLDLTNYLDELEQERKKSYELCNRYDGNIEPPSADQLLRMTDEQKQKMKEWIEKTEQKIKVIKNILIEVNKKISEKERIDRNQWLDYGALIITKMFSIDQYEIVLEQLYRAELTKIIDNFKVSRAEAEERAKLTIEYRQYKEAKRLKENILEFEMMCKKYAGLE